MRRKGTQSLPLLLLFGLLSGCDARGLVARTDPVTFPDSYLVAHYRLDEEAGETVADSSGHGHIGVVRGNLRFAPGVFGNAAWFDGNASIAVPSAADFDFSRDFSIAAWISPSRLEGKAAIVAKDGAVDSALILATRSTALELGPAPDDGDAATANQTGGGGVRGGVLAPARWTHVAATVEFNLTAHLYVDGREVHRSVLSRAPEHGPASLAIGLLSAAAAADAPFVGGIDDLRIYRRALSATEVRALGGTQLNLPPQIDELARAQPGAVAIGQPVAFTMKAHDPEHDPLTYGWDFGDGTSAETPAGEVTHAFNAPGTYVLWPYVADGHHPPLRGNPVAVAVGTTRVPDSYGLSAHWTFREAPGGVAPDVTGHGHDAALGLGSRLTTEMVGDSNVLEVLGADGAADIAKGDELGFTGELTITAWIRPQTGATYPLLNKTGPRSVDALLFGVRAERLELRAAAEGDSINTVTGGHVGLQDWQHVAATITADNIASLYLEGVLVGHATLPRATPPSGTTPPDAVDVQIAGGSGVLGAQAFGVPQDFVGGLADVRIYNYALSVPEIRWLASPITQ